MPPVADLRILADGLDHPEGIATGPDGLLYAGGEAGQVYRIDPEAQASEQVADTSGFVLGLCHDAAGTIYACDTGRASIVRVDPGSGTVDTFCDGAGGAPLKIPNWPAFAPDGTLWLPMPTNVSFFGPELRSLAIASLGGYAVKAIDVDVAGAPLNYPER